MRPNAKHLYEELAASILSDDSDADERFGEIFHQILDSQPDSCREVTFVLKPNRSVECKPSFEEN